MFLTSYQGFSQNGEIRHALNGCREAGGRRQRGRAPPRSERKQLPKDERATRPCSRDAVT
eukprot:5473622-Prymnesium_polylepis.1